MLLIEKHIRGICRSKNIRGSTLGGRKKERESPRAAPVPVGALAIAVGAKDGALTAALGVLYRQTDQGGDDGKLAEMHCKTRRRGHSYKLGKRGERLLERAG
jgi:hypothetical protein